MRSPARTVRGWVLVAIAAHGLVIATLAHAEQHFREEHEHEDQAAAAQEAWTAASGDPLDTLARALSHVHQRPQRQPAGRPHRHSHGPVPSGEHGAGTLSHLALALHAAPTLPQIARPAPDHAAPRRLVAQLHAPLRYLIPERAQGPPARN